MALSDKNKQVLIAGSILGVVLLIIVVYFYFLYVNPGVKNFDTQVDELSQQIRRQEEQIRNIDANLAREQQRRALEEQFRRIEQRLPSDHDPIEVFDLLRGYFEGSDVVFTYIEPGDSKNRGRFTEFPFTIRGSARYHEFGQLVNLIECNPDRLMRVTDFRLLNNNRRPSIHPMEIGIATFTFNEKN